MCCPLRPCQLALAAIVAWPAAAATQSLGAPLKAAIAPSLVVYHLSRSRSETPKAAIGLSALVGRAFGSYVQVRGGVGAWASIPGGDPVSICQPLPGGGCAAAPVVPDRLWTAQLDAVVRVLPSVPVFGVVACGIVVPDGARKDSLPASRGLVRTGVEIGDGRGLGGLRLQVTRLVFVGGIRALRSGIAIAVLVRL